jgi:hypothetical protein
MLIGTIVKIQESELQGRNFIEATVNYLNEMEGRHSYSYVDLALKHFDYDFKILRCEFIIRCNGIRPQPIFVDSDN